MAKIKNNDGLIRFHCPGCGLTHAISVNSDDSPHWGWNGSEDAPTFTPSILWQWEHWVPPAKPGGPKVENQTRVSDVCHSFITDGMIRFLSDCTHPLAGHVVELPEYNNFIIKEHLC